MSTVTVAVATEARIARRETLLQLVKSKTFIAGVLIVGFWVVCALFGSHLAPHDPQDQSFDPLLSPRSGHLFGTDTLGRDVFSRVLVGAGDILEVAPLAMLLGIAGGTVVGLVTGYFRGVVVVVIGVLFTPLVARTVRAAVLAERQLEYVQAARLRGERAPHVMFVEILPNIMGPIIVEATVRLGYAIFAVAGLTFLGFGVQPPSPDWALQISDNYNNLNATANQGYYWTVLFPGAAVASLVVGVNLIADGIQHALER